MSGADSGTGWDTSPAEASIDRDEVHVWRAGLDVDESLSAGLAASLAPDESERAARFHREVDRARFVAGRGILRDILSRYLHLGPKHIRFSYTRFGKPHLDESGGAGGLTFNVSHSADQALYAVTRGRAVGVDLEAVDRDLDLMELAGRFFSPSEVEALRRLEDEEQRKAFFRVWTRKEAYIKARGMGLSIPLDRFSVSVEPDDPCLLRVDERPDEVDRWRFKDLDAGAAYAASVAAEKGGWRLRCWQWTSPPE